MHIFKAKQQKKKKKESLGNQFITVLTTAIQGEHEYSLDPKYCWHGLKLQVFFLEVV